QPLHIVDRQRRRLRDKPFDGEPPVLEAAGLETLELVARRRDLVGERRLRGLASAELARRRPRAGGALRGLRQPRPGTREAAAVRRAEPVASGDALGNGEAGQPGGRREPAPDHRAAGDCAHSVSLWDAGAPVIIDMTRGPNPASQIIAT